MRLPSTLRWCLLLAFQALVAQTDHAAGAILALTGSLSAGEKAEPETGEPRLNYTVSWLGNTFAEPDKWVQMDAAAMFVASDGTVYLNVFWEEGGRNVGIYKDGQCIGNAGHTHGWGY